MVPMWLQYVKVMVCNLLLVEVREPCVLFVHYPGTEDYQESLGKETVYPGKA